MIFVDTSFWIALRFRRDRNHEVARTVWEASSGALMTTDLVCGETWTFLRRRADHRRALEFIDATNMLARLTIRHVDSDVAEEAWRWLRRHDERPYSFVDATSFAIMRRLRIRRAFAFDGDFSAASFIEIRP